MHCRSARTFNTYVDYLRRVDASPAPADLVARFPTSRWLSVPSVSLKKRTPLYVVSPVCSSTRHAELLKPLSVTALVLTRSSLRGFGTWVRSLGGPFKECVQYDKMGIVDDDQIVIVVDERHPLPAAAALPQAASRVEAAVYVRDSAAVGILGDSFPALLMPVEVNLPEPSVPPAAEDEDFRWQRGPGPFRHETVACSTWHDSLQSNGGDLVEGNDMTERLQRWGADEEMKKRVGAANLTRLIAAHWRQTAGGAVEDLDGDRTEAETPG
jgi:hypothetical protein